MAAYCIFLPNEKARTARYISLFILLINCLVFGFIFFTGTDTKITSPAMAGTMVSVVSSIFILINVLTGKFTAYRPEISFIILAMLWLVVGRYVIALLLIFFAITGFYARRKFKVAFTDDKIIYPSFPSRTFTWEEVSNVLLKDNVLTIDLRNNKLIQVVVDKESAKEVDEKKFNDFCREQISGDGDPMQRH